ncbi:MAG: sulfatase [Paludibaculum sp.]
MLRRNFLRAAGAAAAPAFAKADRRPNILFIMADDHAAHAISAYGSTINETPNIDRIGRDGVRLDNCLCTNSICTSSQATILTGQYSHVNGVRTLNDPLDPARQHVAKLLQAGGYATAMVGKWHLHKDPSGFDYWNILPGQGSYYDPEFIEMGQRKKHTGYCTDLITDFSLEWLKGRPKDKPFFLMCHHKAPHRPWQPALKYSYQNAASTMEEPFTLYDHYENRSDAARRATLQLGENLTKTDLKADAPPNLKGDELRKWTYQRFIKDYLGCVQSVDDSVGRLFSLIAKEDLEENTVIIYTSDQGFFLGDHGWFDKRFMYEEALRMPCLIRYPKEIQHSINRDMILNLDFAETFLDFAGIPAPPDMQGRSFRQNLRGKTSKDWRQSMYYRYWMHLADHNVAAHYGVRTERYKLIYYYGKALGTSGSIDKDTPPEWELFDLLKDPRELNNVYADPAYQKAVVELKATLDRMQKEFGDQPCPA